MRKANLLKDLSAIAYRCELVVVEDGSSDATASILDRLSAEFGKRLTVINHASNSGYGAAASQWNGIRNLERF